MNVKQIIHRLGFSGISDGNPRFAQLERPEALPAGRIPGGSGASELRMLPVDYDPSQPMLRAHVQLKVDGIGGLRVPGAGIVTTNGVPMACAAHCLAGLDRIERRMGEPMVFDGEYSEEAGFAATQSAFRKGAGTGVFWIYDAVPFAEWQKDRCRAPIEDRLERLRAAIPHAESVFIGGLNSWLLSGPEIMRKAEELWSLGYEGVVAKRLRSIYMRRRSCEWQRIKRDLSFDGQIADVLAKAGTVRAIMVRGPEGRDITVGVPKSFAVDQLAKGRMVEVSYQPVVGGGYRALKLVRMRPDKDARP